MDEFDANVIAHFETLGALHEPPFGRWLIKPYPRAFIRCAGNDGVELLSNFSGQQQRGSRLADLAFNFGGGIFLIGAMLGEVGYSSSADCGPTGGFLAAWGNWYL